MKRVIMTHTMDMVMGMVNMNAAQTKRLREHRTRFYKVTLFPCNLPRYCIVHLVLKVY